ncbi:hypothetical protein Tco_0804587 [Tanacetum coccineum]|uniref:Uncharacterized protein n=1 Tax=Tanacetum coccineum TaxID=301880 RepID=A0ABQ5A4Q7_9ASTR
MSVRQVWKRKTPLPKSSPTCHNDSPPPPPRNTPHSISPPMDYPQRDRIINQLHTISTLIDSQTPTPPSSPHPLVQPPTNAQVGCHASFCHCCRRHFKSLSLDELRSPDFNLFSDQEYSKEEEAEAMAETMEQYMSKTRTDYGFGSLLGYDEEKIVLN